METRVRSSEWEVRGSEQKMGFRVAPNSEPNDSELESLFPLLPNWVYNELW